MSGRRLVSSSAVATAAAGRAFGEGLMPPVVVCLRGDLGAGKTQFARGVCQALGVDPRDVRSPTYTLINRYDGRVTVYHVDLYRLDRPADVSGLGLEEILAERAVVLIEWPERLPEPVPGAVTVDLRGLSRHRREILLPA